MELCHAALVIGLTRVLVKYINVVEALANTQVREGAWLAA